MNPRFAAVGAAAFRQTGSRFWVRAAAITVGVGLAIALPTVLIASRFFTRMTPVRWYDYVLWAVSSPLIGLTMAARALPGARRCRVERRGLSAAGLTLLAVGCPICNKAVVALVGVSGALTYFAPLQPALGIASIALLLATLHRVLSGSSTTTPPLDASDGGPALPRAESLPSPPLR